MAGVVLLCPVRHGALGAGGGIGAFIEGGIWVFVAPDTPAPVTSSRRLDDMLRICGRLKGAGGAFEVLEEAPTVEQSPALISLSLS